MENISMHHRHYFALVKAEKNPSNKSQSIPARKASYSCIFHTVGFCVVW